MAWGPGVWRWLALPLWVLSLVVLAATWGSVLAWVGVAFSSVPLLGLLEERRAAGRGVRGCSGDGEGRV